MGYTILLYGATGYSGRLIAAEAVHRMRSNAEDIGEFRWMLAGRDKRAVAELAATHDLEHRTFGLNDARDVARGLVDVDLVLNAAGPFEQTAPPLARAALAARCHYVDINGESHVYRRMGDLGRAARQRELALIGGAGHSAAASDLLIRAALEHVKSMGVRELGAVRIAHTRTANLSRGSVATLWRSLREQVTVVRLAPAEPHGDRPRKTVLWHEPIGRLERTFDFRDGPAPSRRGADAPPLRPGTRIASAANLVDTLTARLTVVRQEVLPHRIESYVEVGTLGRIGYQLASFMPPVAAVPFADGLARFQISLLPEGPAPRELQTEGATVVVEIEDTFRRRIVDWSWHMPNAYVFTARVATEIAEQAVRGGRSGWLTPSDVLSPPAADLTSKSGYLRECRLEGDPVAVPEFAS